MDEITKLSYNSIVKYYSTLNQFGYKSYEDVYKLIALNTLEELLNIFPEYITEKDLRAIYNAIYCLSGTTCLVDFPEYINDDSTIHNIKLNFIARVTENDLLRFTQNDLIRLEA